MKEKIKWQFDGKIFICGSILAKPRMVITTYAVSIPKAISNIKFRYRRDAGYGNGIEVRIQGVMYGHDGIEYSVDA